MVFLPQEIIVRKRDGEVLTRGEIGQFIAGLTDGSVSHAQAAAWCACVAGSSVTMRLFAIRSRAARAGVIPARWSSSRWTSAMMRLLVSKGVRSRTTARKIASASACRPSDALTRAIQALLSTNSTRAL